MPSGRRSSALTLSVLLLLAGASVAAAATEKTEAALRDARQWGQVLCKTVTSTDAGASRSNQAGLYLPKQAWPFFSRMAPVEEENRKETVHVEWPQGPASEASLSWYGKGSRSEFRLTRLGGRLTPASVGDLLVLIPAGPGNFRAHLLDSEEEISAFCSELGIEPGERWELHGGTVPDRNPGSENGALEAWAARTAAGFDDFPSGRTMAELARQGVRECSPEILTKTADDRLLAWIRTEYTLYREIERRVSLDRVRRPFDDVDAFLASAASLLNRRKSRAGHSLEAHTEYLLTEAGIRFEAQALTEGHSRPDILFPGAAAYADPSHPLTQLAVLALKTTCRDRWRQVLNEAARVPGKDLLTLQPAMSRAQLQEMRTAGVRLVVPAQLHPGYDAPPGGKPMTVEEYLAEMRRRFPR